MYRKMLVPLDRSQVAECILPHVRQIAGGCEGCEEVILLEVVATPPAWVMEKDGIHESHEAQKKLAREYLSQIKSRLISEGLKGPAITTEVQVSEHPAEAIIDFTKQKAVDIILMVTNVNPGISKLMIGSVADRVIRYSHVPTLVVRPEFNKDRKG